MRKTLLIGILLLCNSASSLFGSSAELEQLYRRGAFSRISGLLEERVFEELTENEKYLFLESLARNGEGFKAIPLLHAMLKNQNPNDTLLAAGGMVYHSAGDLPKAREFFEKALAVNPRNHKALFSKALLMLFYREFDQAEYLYEKALSVESRLDSHFTYLYAGTEIYFASQNSNKLIGVNRKLADFFESHQDTANTLKYRAESAMLEKNRWKPLYKISESSDKIVLPMFNFSENVFYKCLKLKLHGRDYNILLDTGNGPGWTVHEPELLKSLSHIFGGSVNTSTGSVEHSFFSNSLITEKVDLGAFSLSNLKGLYFEKPREAYFDANLNPVYIRDKVVTMDYINNLFILRSRERFIQDMDSVCRTEKVRLPFYGWKWPFIPVKVNSYADALAMIETGAEDLAVKREFADFINLPIESAEKEFRGKMYPFHQSEIDVLIGHFLLHREKSEVWPRRFFDNITGLYDNVMIGPWALEGGFIIHFNPFDNEILFQVGADDKRE